MSGERQVERGPGRPGDGYYLPSGDKAFGVTTVLGRFKNSKFLIRWGWNQGLEEGRLRAEARMHKRRRKNNDLYKRRDEAGDVGSVAHDAFEDYLHGEDGYARIRNSKLAPEFQGEATKALDAFVEWAGSYKFDLLATETPLVSQYHEFAGTPDAVARVNGKLCILDWKTSKGIYDDMLIQVGAYALLWHEVRGEKPEGAHVIRLSKHSGGFEHRFAPAAKLEAAKKQFLRYLEMYRHEGEVKW